MISSCMFSTAPMTPKNADTTGMMYSPRSPNVRTSPPTTAGSVPSRSTMNHAPPTKKITAMTSAAATNPRGTATAAAKRPTGARGTE